MAGARRGWDGHTRPDAVAEVGQALAVKKRHLGLSANDCFCLVTARVCPGILLTGDTLLHRGCCAVRNPGPWRALGDREAYRKFSLALRRPSCVL